MLGGVAQVGRFDVRIRPSRGWRLAGILLAAIWMLVVASPVTAQGITHVVLPGETLDLIATEYGTTILAIAQANGLTSPDSLWIGQELWIPLESGVERETEASGSHGFHVVQLGETLADIAYRYRVSMSALIELNSISDPELLWVGQELLVPGLNPPSTPSAPVTSATATPKPFLPLSDILLTPTPTPTAASTPSPDQGEATSVEGSELGTEDPVVRPTPTVIPPPDQEKHTVKAGETLGMIARQYGTTAAAIARLNGLTSPDLVHVGIELAIPHKDWTTPLFPGKANRFVVSISQQRCWLYQGNVQIADWLCSTGQRGTATRPGTYAIQSKMEKAYGSAWNIWMPYWLGIYWAGASENGIHGLPYDADSGLKLWEGLVGSPVTYGCVLLTDEHAAILYEMAYEGMPVIIQP